MKVTAAIFRNGDKVLLMRRAVDQSLAGEWEYPGGKFEDGEDGPICLKRELAEELGIRRTNWRPDYHCKAYHGFWQGNRTAYIRNQILYR